MPTGQQQEMQLQAAVQQPGREARDGSATVQITWQEPQGFVWLSLKNALLKLLTLGIYHFWGKTEVRRRLWHAIRVNGEPLEYTGTGLELFKGFWLVVGGLFLAFLLYSLLVAFIFSGQPPGYMELPMYVVIGWLTGLGIYRARRYRLRRTRWRGIRGTMAGSASEFAHKWFASGLLVPLTLGWIIPHRSVELHRILTNDTRVGSAPLKFSEQATAKPLYPLFAMVWFTFFMLALMTAGALIYLGSSETNTAAVVTYSVFAAGIGLVGLYLLVRYHAFRLNWLARNTHLHGGHFVLDFRPADLVRLVLGNVLIAVFSLGLLMPVVQKRLVRHFVQRLKFVGTVDLAAISQAGDKLEKTGEGLAEAFDIDAF